MFAEHRFISSVDVCESAGTVLLLVKRGHIPQE